MPVEGEPFERAAEIVSAAHVACFEWPDAPASSNELRAASCFALGTALRENERLRNRSGADWTPYLAFQNGCAFGGKASCEARERESVRPPLTIASSTPSPTENDIAEAQAPATSGSDIPGANLHVDTMNVDGIRLDDIQCRVHGNVVGGLLGTIIVGAGFKSRRYQLVACSQGKGIEARVYWSGKGGRMADIHATGRDAPINACVAKALGGAVSTVNGDCAATLILPKP